MEMDEMYDFLRDVVGVSEDALDLAFGIKNYSKETAEDILDWYTGYKDFESYIADFEWVN